MESLCILLPLTSRGCSPAECIQEVERLGAAFCDTAPSSAPPQPHLSICIGLDASDPLVEHAEELAAALPGHVLEHTVIFNAEEQARRACLGTPLCWMWSELAAAATHTFQPAWLLLLGEDVRVEPAGWPAVLAEYAAAHPQLKCIALLDMADPGFPSFPAVHARHLQVFGRMLPNEFVNQGGDPFLFELYRSSGAADVCPSVRIHNDIGGMEHSIFTAQADGSTGQDCSPPRYQRYALKPAELNRLVDTARVLIQIDNPAPGDAALAWLRQQQLARLHSLRTRSGANEGAAAARNRLLDESFGCDYIVFVDDDCQPAPGCLDAYVSAFQRHPEDSAFAGPTVLPRLPACLLPTAIHMSDVSFFWEAPLTLGWSHVPWAVTANMAVKQTGVRFRDGFPKSGGGEDIDFCLLLGGRLRAVPQAAAVHPWWPEGRPLIYRRFWRWAQGDGHLIDLWPAITYRRAPNPVELGCVLAVLGLMRIISVPQACAGLAAALAADLVLDVLRNCLLAQRRRQHPCRCWLRPLAAAEACAIKTSSEAGRLYGHLRRGSWGSLLASFDWFGGAARDIVRGEQQRVALRCAVCLAAACVTVMMWA